MQRTSHARSWLCTLGGCALLAAVAVVATWPLASQLDSHQALGTLSSRTVPLFNLYSLLWNQDRLAHGYDGYWDAPFFFPTKGAFALSEPQPLLGVLFSLLAPWIGALAAYNVLVLCLLVLNGASMRRLLSVLGASPLVASATGVLGVCLPFALRELGVVQQLALFPIPFALAELCLLARGPSTAAFVRLALALFALALSCGHHSVLFSVPCALGLGVGFRRDWLGRPLLRALGLVLLPLVLVAGFLLTQRAHLKGHSRSDAAIRKSSALIVQYGRLPPGTLLTRAVPELAGPPNKKNLYPGTVVLGLAVLGLSLHVRARGPHAGSDRRFVLYCAAAALLCFLCSFGTRIALFGLSPYELVLERFWPGFAQLRSAYRFAAQVQLYLLVLAGLGLARLEARRHGKLLVLALCALALFELVPFGARTARYPREQVEAPWVHALRAQPSGAVVAIPPSPGKRTADYEATTIAMLASLRHGHPLVNGYSGFFPKQRVLRKLERFPGKKLLSELRVLHVRYAVVERSFVRERLAKNPLRKFPKRIHEDAERIVYELR